MDKVGAGACSSHKGRGSVAVPAVAPAPAAAAEVGGGAAATALCPGEAASTGQHGPAPTPPSAATVKRRSGPKSKTSPYIGVTQYKKTLR